MSMVNWTRFKSWKDILGRDTLPKGWDAVFVNPHLGSWYLMLEDPDGNSKEFGLPDVLEMAITQLVRNARYDGVASARKEIRETLGLD